MLEASQPKLKIPKMQHLLSFSLKSENLEGLDMYKSRTVFCAVENKLTSDERSETCTANWFQWSY